MKVILVDDFQGQWPVGYFLQFADRYPFFTEIKGKMTQINKGTTIVFTSNVPPGELYPTYRDQWAILRRLRATHFSDFFLAHPRPFEKPPNWQEPDEDSEPSAKRQKT